MVLSLALAGCPTSLAEQLRKDQFDAAASLKPAQILLEPSEIVWVNRGEPPASQGSPDARLDNLKPAVVDALQLYFRGTPPAVEPLAARVRVTLLDLERKTKAGLFLPLVILTGGLWFDCGGPLGGNRAKVQVDLQIGSDVYSSIAEKELLYSIYDTDSPDGAIGAAISQAVRQIAADPKRARVLPRTGSKS
jgi:hypothetical protein